MTSTYNRALAAGADTFAVPIVCELPGWPHTAVLSLSRGQLAVKAGADLIVQHAVADVRACDASGGWITLDVRSGADEGAATTECRGVRYAFGCAAAALLARAIRAQNSGTAVAALEAGAPMRRCGAVLLTFQ